ncbi:MAG TPA: carboxypeptidase regulatory-like domain-containing protein [Vicinamibacterales bacterium]|nr:carboxypeptidase regulatory-like domain-containing protein [Vicinamibacterales bacterium]
MRARETVRLAAIIILLLPAALFAQSGSSSISGLVKDSTGAPLPGVLVMVRNVETAVAFEAVTNEDGVYRVGALVPGSYRVEATVDGFEPAVRAVTLAVSQALAIDITLDVARQSETVTVEATVPLVDSQTSTIAQTITREMLTALPLPNRAASSLVSLAPGVIMIDTGAGTAENYPVFSVAGGRARNQNFILDGGNASNAVGLTRPQQLTTLPVDAMQEFKVITNNYGAEFGHSTGGVIVMSTRSGSNDFRGTVFESFRDDALDAKNVFAASKPPIDLNQFGGTFGGPIRRSRTFFFGSWERTRQLTSETVLSTVPTLRNRAGDFSDLRSSAGVPIVVYDPVTRQPLAGNVIPADRIDPVARAALQYYPLPNREGTASNANNYVGNSDSTLDRDILVGRVDHQLRTTDLLTVRYYINNSGTNVTGSYGNAIADPLAGSTDVRVQSLTGAHTHIFTPTLVNELRVTYLRRRFIDGRPGLGSNLAGTIGLSGVTAQAFPAFNIPGYAALSSAAVSRFQTPILDRQVLESVSWSKRRHAFKFGGEFRGGANDEIRDRGSSGNLTFTPLITSNLGAANTGNALASFLLGEVNAGSVQISDLIRSRASYWAFYAQDDWRVTSRLTLNYGLRWEAELPRREVDNRMNSFDPLAINPVSGTPGVVTFAGINRTPARAFATDWNNVGPRVGFAYQLNQSGRTVLRGGTGIFYGPTVSNTIGDVAALGFSTSASFVVSQATTESAFLLRDGFPAYGRPDLTPGFGAVPAGTHPNTAVSFFDPHQVAPTSYQVNLDLQRELSRGLVVEAGYIGNFSRHLTANDFSINQVPDSLVGPGDTQALRPFPQFSNVTLINPSIGRSSYHGGFVRVEKRFSRGFSMLAHYTKSRFMDDVESANEYGVTGSYMDQYHRRLDWARSASDVPNHVVLTAMYEVPSFGGGLAAAVLGGWRFSALETLQSGPPFTVVTAANTTNAFPAGPLRPNLVGDPELPASERTLSRWFNTAAFANPASFTFGNAPRSVLRGPGLATLDATVEKSIALGAGMKFDVRAEAYNLLNRANFTIPGYTLGAADFGVVSGARPARTVELGARLSF